MTNIPSLGRRLAQSLGIAAATVLMMSASQRAEALSAINSAAAPIAKVASDALITEVHGGHGGGGGFHGGGGGGGFHGGGGGGGGFHGGGFGGGGFHGGGFHGGGFHGGGFHGRFAGGFHRRGFVGFGFGPYAYYDDYPYYDDDGGCYLVRQRVHTRHGWRIRPVEVCE
jgi:hypothetical protein